MIYTLQNKDAELFDLEMTNGNIRKTANLRKEKTIQKGKSCEKI